jgi:hypothetical protein
LILQRAVVAEITRNVAATSLSPEAVRQVTKRQVDPWTVARRLTG